MTTEFGLRNREVKIRFGRKNRRSISNFTKTTTAEVDIWDPVSTRDVDKRKESGTSENTMICNEYVSLIRRVRERKQLTISNESTSPKKSPKHKASLNRTTTPKNIKHIKKIETTHLGPSLKNKQSSNLGSQASSVELTEDSQESLEDIFANFLGDSGSNTPHRSTHKVSNIRSRIAHSLKRAHTDSEYAVFKSRKSNLLGDSDGDDNNLDDAWKPVIFTDKIPVRSSTRVSRTSDSRIVDVSISDSQLFCSSIYKENKTNTESRIFDDSMLGYTSASQSALDQEKEAKDKGKRIPRTYRQKKSNTPDTTTLTPPSFSRAKTDLDATPRKSILARKLLSPSAQSTGMPTLNKAKSFTEGEGWWDEDTVERDLVDDADEQFTDIKSQHELRELGESKRFNDEMEYVLDGLDPTQSLSVRRTSGLELVRKLLSSNFSMKLRAHNCIPKIYELLRDQNDPIILACRAFMLCLLMQDKRNLEFLPLEDHCMELLMELLTIEPDPLAQIDWGSTKSERRLIKELRGIIVTSRVILGTNTISIKFLAARALLSIVSRKTRNEEVVRERVRESGILQVVCSIVEKYLEPLDQRLSGSDQIVLDHLDILETTPYLRILESATQFCPTNQDIVAQNAKIHRRLLMLALYLQVDVSSGNLQRAIQVMDSISGVLRLLINLSNDHEECSRLISEAPGLVIVMQLLDFSQSNSGCSADNSLCEALSASRYDVALLSIGLLINIVDANAECKSSIREAEFCINRKCHTKLSLDCCCSKKLALEYLIEFYVRIQNGASSTEHNVLVAYVALLLGCLMKQNLQNQRFIVRLLPERSVHSLVTILEEFLQFNSMIGGGSAGEAFEFASIAELEKAATGEPPSEEPKSIADSFNDIIDFLKTLSR